MFVYELVSINWCFPNIPSWCETLDKDTKQRTSYIDIKSEMLRDILKTVLAEVYGINLGEDKPTM